MDEDDIEEEEIEVDLEDDFLEEEIEVDQEVDDLLVEEEKVVLLIEGNLLGTHMVGKNKK